MKTIKPFMDLGWYTVPLKGELTRLPNGDKTTPIFERNWKAKYTEELNLNATELGGVLTGKLSDVIAIDCDSSETFDLFHSLDPDNEFIFLSKGKALGGGTIIYKYPFDPDLNSFQIQDDNIHLDFYSDGGFVYLPTDTNSTKVKWGTETTPLLKEAPVSVMVLLKALYKSVQAIKDAKAMAAEPTALPERVSYLAPQLELMMAKQEFLPSVFKIITPKDFRTEAQYVKFGYLHPENIPIGRGSEYLSKVSAILGADSSVSQDLYLKVMKFLNDAWEEPISQSRFTSTILEPMLEAKATVDGKVIWQYDENWKIQGMTFTTKFGEAAEVFFDDVRAMYYLINHNSGLVKAYQKDIDVHNYMSAIGVDVAERKSFKQQIPLVRTTMDPATQFGFYNIDDYTRYFNLFKQSPALRILNEPESYKPFYNKPRATLSFFKSLVPDNLMRNYLLQFMKYKLKTFRYSPVVLFFLGVHGSGKDTFVNILANILGPEYIGKPSTKEFLEQFNGWIVDTYFTQLDEYGNQLAKFTEKQEALGKIKAYSGKADIQIRQMRTDGFSYKHNTTFIMTANSNPLLLEAGDRRLAFFDTPNVLKDETWVRESGGISRAIAAIEQETKDFCYYLANDVGELDPDSYVSPPVTKRKHQLISQQLPAAQRLSYLLKNLLYKELYELTKEYDTPEVFQHSSSGRIFENDLMALYFQMTDGNGQKRGLSAAMRDAGIKKSATTKDGEKIYFFEITDLAIFELPDAGFTDLEAPGL